LFTQKQIFPSHGGGGPETEFHKGYCVEKNAKEILDRVTGSDPSVTDYVLEEPVKCPNCRREILEKTLVEAI
jgi:hypothetical protein